MMLLLCGVHSDEACANTRVELDSQPEVIDALERRKVRLEVEAMALEKEVDSASVKRRERVLSYVLTERQREQARDTAVLVSRVDADVIALW